MRRARRLVQVGRGLVQQRRSIKTTAQHISPENAWTTTCVFSSDGEAFEPWQKAFAPLGVTLLPYQQAIQNPTAIQFAAVWAPAPGALSPFPQLRGIFNLGAGVDKILRDPTVPTSVPLIRLRDAGMGAQMAEYCAYGVLRFHRDFDHYEARQRKREWRQEPGGAVAAGDRNVGVLGAGVLGKRVARTLVDLGFSVRTWSRTPPKTPSESEPPPRRTWTACHGPTFEGPAFDAFLSGLDVLVNLLPLTPATTGLLDARLFRKLPRGAALVNAGRGAHIVTHDLLVALDSGSLRGALLDVFDPDEPLPPDHPLWTHPRVTVTPHVAAQTVPTAAAAQIADAMRQWGCLCDDHHHFFGESESDPAYSATHTTLPHPSSSSSETTTTTTRPRLSLLDVVDRSAGY